MRAYKLFIVLGFFLITLSVNAEGCPGMDCKTDNGIFYHRVFSGYGQVAYVVKLDSFLLNLERPGAGTCGTVDNVTVLRNGEKLEIKKENTYYTYPAAKAYKFLGLPGKYEIFCRSNTVPLQFSFEIVRSAVGLNESVNNSKTTFNLFPNPASNEIYASFNESVSAEIHLLNSLGLLVETYFLEGTMCRMTLNNLPAGVYFVKVISQGKKFESKRVTVL